MEKKNIFSTKQNSRVYSSKINTTYIINPLYCRYININCIASGITKYSNNLSLINYVEEDICSGFP